MRPLFFALFLVCLTTAPHALRAQEASPRNVVAIEHVNVVDVAAGRVLADQTVVIQDGRITDVGRAKSVKTPKNGTRVDGREKYLIPGLWDMHVHAAWPGIDEIFAPLFVANGVTGVREMYGSLPVIHAWKDHYAAGDAWPRMIGAGHILDGPKPFWPGSTIAATPEQARQAVDSLHAAGADFIKVYGGLSRESYAAAINEARKLGIDVAGHVPDAVSVSDASDLGQYSIEHLTGVALECSKEADALRAERAAAAIDTSKSLLATYARQTERVLVTQDEARCDELAKQLARNHTWQVPTLVVLRSMASLDETGFTSDKRVRYMPKEVADSWDWKTDFRFRSRTPENWANAKRMYQRNLEIVGRLHQAGVPIVAGTDVLNPFCFPGFSLHDELALLVEAGLSPADALRSATLNAAIFMKAKDSLGTVEKGKTADVVLLDANPLEDIRNTQKVRAVVLNGKFYDRNALDGMMSRAEETAKAAH